MDLLEKLKLITDEKNIFLNEPMSKHTTFRAGGPADIFVVPKSKQEIIDILKLDVKKTVIGNGSNLLVKDGGIRGLVIKVAINNFEVNDNVITAESGCSLMRLSNVAMENSLTGMEFACGIPGSLGGALVMNAGAYGAEMKDIVVETEVADMNGNVEIITNHEFGYRTSVFQNRGLVVLSSKLKLNYGDKEIIKNQMEEYLASRRQKQPLNKPSAGSTFKRPVNNFAGKLIEEAGLKGCSVGDAEVSTLHAGFIVNNGNATAKDILDLIEIVKAKVNAEFGVMLEPEVRIIGEEK